MTRANVISTRGAGSRALTMLGSNVQSRNVKRFRDWADFVNSSFPWLEHRNHCGGTFIASISTFSFGNGSIATIKAGASEVLRTRPLAAAAESGHIKLLWQLAGTMDVEQDRRCTVMQRGQSTAIDTTRSYRCRLSDGAYFAVLTLPHDACPGWERISQKLCGTALAENNSLRAAFGAVMALTDPVFGEHDIVGDSVLRAVQSLVTTSLHQSAHDLDKAGHGNAKLRKAEQHILAHISDPALDPNDLAAALCMSRRSLYMLFKDHQLTPSKMIHDVRLQRCRQALDEPASRSRKITDIAFDHGFNDYATFSRLFKQQFGVTPSEFRQRGNSAPRS